MGDEFFPRKDGKILTADIDYIDVWRVRTHVFFLNVHSKYQDQGT